LSDIQPSGAIRLQNGSFRQEELGFAVNNTEMQFSITQDSLILNNFSAQQQDGRINISGFAALDSSIFTGILNALEIKVNAENFFISQKPEHELEINSNIDIQGPVDSLKMAGDLEILQASIYLPALMQTTGPSRTVQTPLLVKATTAAQSDTIVIDSVQQMEAKIKAPPIMENLRGSIDVNMPKNIWIRNDNFRVEIGGNIEIIKNATFFELFGAINILRGQYDFLGRRFKLTEGTVSFQGGEQINPMLNIAAQYTFRDSQRDKRIVNLIVTGQAMNPDISFKLDDENITEGEAVSYILFNRSPEEVGAQQSGSAPSQTGYLATDLVYGALSAELSRRFGQQLGVDYIEIKGEDKLSTATFVVGKYITPDLFMSYEHSIGTLEEDRSPQVVTVEYELTKYIFLQLVSGDTKNSGADIIFKFDKEVD
jgi:translocation and assembly module TamB